MKLINFVLNPRVRNTVLLCLLAVVIFLVRVSYSPSDPGWTHATGYAEVSNFFGRYGAILADMLIHYFGHVVYVIPGLIVIKVVSLIGSGKALHWWYGPMAFTGFVLIVSSLCVLVALWNGGSFTELQQSGGVVGSQIVMLGHGKLNGYVMVVIAQLGLCLGLFLAIRFSWINVMSNLGAGCFGIVQPLARLFQRDSRSTRPVLKKTPPTTTGKQPQTKQSAPSKGAKRKSNQLKQRKSRQNDKRVEPTVSRAKPRTSAVASPKPTKLPSMNLLQGGYEKEVSDRSLDLINRISEELSEKLADFGIESEVVSITSGPVVTRFELQLAPGIKVSKVSNLVKDLARALAVSSVRVVEIIPGKSVIGIEIPNDDRSTVFLKQVLETAKSFARRSPLTLVLGKDVAGNPIFADIERMPHLLVAGTTGSGKSVCINVLLVSLLFQASPDQVRLILIDPKMLELSTYEDIPHLLTPVVTDMQEASHSLKWCIAEMERRYQLMAALGVRNISGFNALIEAATEAGEKIPDPLRPFDELDSAESLSKLPLIVVVVDEFADMMMIVGKKVEQLIARLAQKARAAGIHLVLATQRPSVDVITGLIKANIPSRISFQVSSQIDSRTIIDQGGAEQLLGHGDMLYLPTGSGVPIRVHGAFVSEKDVKNVADAWRKIQQPEYIQDVTSGTVEPTPGTTFAVESSNVDELYQEAVEFVVDKQKVSVSSVQRKLRVGYNRAARMVEAMEESGVVSEADTNGARKVLITSV